MGIVFGLMSAIVFAFGNIFIKKGIKRSNNGDTGFFMSIITNVVILGVIFFISLVIKGFEFKFSWTALFFFILAGILSSGIGRFTLFASIGRIGPSRGSAIKNGFPIVSVIFGFFILGETVRTGSIWGMLMMLIAILLPGITLFQMHKDHMGETAATSEQKAEVRSQWIGYLLAMLSAVSFGIGMGVRKQGLMQLDDAFFGAFVGALTSLIIFSIYEMIRGKLIDTIRRNFTVYNPYFLGAGIMTSLGPLFFFLGASNAQVAIVSVFAGTEPLLTTLLSVFLLKGEERLTPTVWLSVILVLAGTILISYAG